MNRMLSLLCAIACLPLAVSAAEKPQASAIGRQIEPFTLRDYRGAEWSLGDVKDAKLVVVAFLGTECPLVKLYGGRLSKIHSAYGEKVAVVGINANSQDSVTEIGHYARTHKIKFPILKDVGNVVADKFAAERTPEVFLLDENRVVRYHGRIDDQYGVGYQKIEVGREDLKIAIDELLAGKPVSQPETKPPGCIIGRVFEPSGECKYVYTRDIAPILNRHCVECHRKGQIAPFALTSYEDVAGWGETIAEVIEDQRMPPWHASPQHGKFSNDARMSEAEKQIIYDWVRAGAPQGDPTDLPEPPTFPTDWQIPEPDAVVYMSDKSFTVPAEGEVKYQYFVVDPGFKEDKWVKAAECRPGNRSVVHHIIVAVRPPGGRGKRKVHGEFDTGWLAATAPGAPAMILPDGMAKKVPAGSKLLFQMHYTPTGSVQKDRSCVGLVFADPAEVRREVVTNEASNHRFRIPPQADHHRVEASKTIRDDALLISMFPHMHLRGKAFRYEAVYPDGKSEILLDIPRYDFNWQNTYTLSEPKLLPKGTRIHCVAHFDNSKKNLANPDPSETVRWGDQTWEEMMIGYFNLAPAEPIDPASQLSRTEQFVQQLRRQPITVTDEIKQLAAKATQSPEDFMAFGLALQKKVPQLDRICLTVVEEGKLKIEQAAQSRDLQKLLGGRGVEVRAAPLAITDYARNQKVAVNDDLSEVKAPDMRFMQRALSSSLHVPMNWMGKPSTLNFWSGELKAFPPEAVKLLKEVAAVVAKSQD